MRPFYVVLFLISLVSSSRADDLRTVAESSDYRATARHAEVVQFCEKLAESPRVHLAELGKSGEGRSLPLLIVADPPVIAPGDLTDDSRILVFLFGNIHAGEVCGKEALLSIARDVAHDKSSPLLKNLVLAIAPIYNADGNEKIGKDTRPNQDGPAEGCGIRYNSQGLDLNRDWMKVEAPETRAFLKFLRRWDPAAIVDTHTTNGSAHRFLVTYGGPKHPAGDAKLNAYAKDVMFPDIDRRSKEKGLDTYYYGNFDRERTLWTTYPANPRYGTPYRGLRGRVAILSEAYSYAPFKDRVIGTEKFVLSCLEHFSGARDEIRDLVKGVDDRARSGVGGESLALRTRAVADGRAKILGYEEKLEDGKRVTTEALREYDLELVNQFEATHSVRRPLAYVYPARLSAVTEKLLLHGVQVEELSEDIELDLEVYRISELSRAEREFQKHRMVTLRVESERATRRVVSGSRIVRSAQKLGTIAALLLEAESADGLAAWNVLDEEIRVGGEYPIARLQQLPPLLTASVRLEEDRPEKKAITFDRVYEKGERPPSGRSAMPARWLDAEHYLIRKEGEICRVHAESGRCERVEGVKGLAEAFAAIPAIDLETAERLVSGSRYVRSEDGSGALVNFKDDLYYAPYPGGGAESLGARRLTSEPSKEELAEFSPDGRFVAFVRYNDLWVVDVETATQRALTRGGTDTLRRGKASWVYFEEVFGRSWKALWWSPNSRRIAYLETDCSPVLNFTLVDNRPNRQRVETSTYPKPGEANPNVKLGIVSVAGGATDWVDLSGYDAADRLVTGVGWWPDS
ncbi:MAG: DPP IV N-terminal domain-containing protein, partial [Planctomycetota bacterium]